MADADFNHRLRQIPQDLAQWLDSEQIAGRSIEDTVDLLCYRQLHSPILTPAPFSRDLPALAEVGDLFVASCLELCQPREGNGNPVFRHPSGFEVEAKEDFIRIALATLRPLWPRGLQLKTLFPDLDRIEEDLRLLHRNELIELRCIEPGDFGVDGDELNILERDWNGCLTTPYHTREAAAAQP